jgi:hypothetical protein
MPADIDIVRDLAQYSTWHEVLQRLSLQLHTELATASELIMLHAIAERCNEDFTFSKATLKRLLAKEVNNVDTL